MADVARDLLRCGTQSGDGVGDDEINLAGVGLGGDVVAAGEVGFLAQEFVELIALGRVAVENLQEGGLRPGGPLSSCRSIVSVCNAEFCN